MDEEERIKRARKEGHVRAGIDPLQRISPLQWEVQQRLSLDGEATKRLQVTKHRCNASMKWMLGRPGTFPAERRSGCCGCVLLRGAPFWSNGGLRFADSMRANQHPDPLPLQRVAG